MNARERARLAAVEFSATDVRAGRESRVLTDIIAAAIEAAEARGREAERAEVVTWLRRPLSVLRELIVSDAIERGDHLGARDAE